MMIAKTPKNPKRAGAAYGIAAGLITVVVCCVVVVTGVDAQDRVKIGILAPKLFKCDMQKRKEQHKIDKCEAREKIIKKLKSDLEVELNHLRWNRLFDLETREYPSLILSDSEKITAANDFIKDERLSLLVRFTIDDYRSQEDIWSYEVYLHNVTDIPDDSEEWFAVGRFTEPIKGNIEPGVSITAGEQLLHKIWREVQGVLGYKVIFVGCLNSKLSDLLKTPSDRLSPELLVRTKKAVDVMINNFPESLTKEMAPLMEELTEAGGALEYEFGWVDPAVYEQHCAGNDHNEFKQEKGRSFYYVEGVMIEKNLKSWALPGDKYIRIKIVIKRGNLEGPRFFRDGGKTYVTMDYLLVNILDEYDHFPKKAATMIEKQWPIIVKDMNPRD